MKLLSAIFFALFLVACGTTQAQRTWELKSAQMSQAHQQLMDCSNNVTLQRPRESELISKVLWTGAGDPPLAYIQNNSTLSGIENSAFIALFDASQQCVNQYSMALASSDINLSNLISSYAKIRSEIGLALVNQQITLGDANGYFRNLDREMGSLWLTGVSNMQSAINDQHQAEIADRNARLQAFGAALQQTYGPRPAIDVYVHD